MTSERTAWVDWLVKIGYGMDFATDEKPPCTLEELADGWLRRDAAIDGAEAVDGQDVKTYAWSIVENTGAWG